MTVFELNFFFQEIYNSLYVFGSSANKHLNIHISLHMISYVFKNEKKKHKDSV